MNPSLKTEDFSASAELDRGRLVTTLAGNADLDTKAPLAEFLSQLHEEACARSVSEVVVDLRSVEFMNSNCLKTFVTWIFVAKDLPVQDRYQIVLRSNPNILWQRRSVEALSCVARDLVRIDA
jgi:hypothetical protein